MKLEIAIFLVKVNAHFKFIFHDVFSAFVEKSMKIYCCSDPHATTAVLVHCAWVFFWRHCTTVTQSNQDFTDFNDVVSVEGGRFESLFQYMKQSWNNWSYVYSVGLTVQFTCSYIKTWLMQEILKWFIFYNKYTTIHIIKVFH